MLILINIFLILYIILDAWHDHYIESGSNDWHIVDVIQKGFVWVFIAYLLIPKDYELYYIGKWYEVLMLLLMFAAYRFLLFNFIYNAFAGQPWHYLSDRGIDLKIRGWKRVWLLFGCIFYIAFINYYLY